MINRTTVLWVLLLLHLSPVTWAQDATRVDPLTEYYRGHLDQAERLATTRDDSHALTVRAHLALMRGELDSARSFSQAAVSAANSNEERDAAALVRAQLEWRDGDWKGAEALLRKRLVESPQAHDVRLQLGAWLKVTGRDEEAEVILDAMSGFYNNGLIKTSHQLATLAQAMRLLGSFQDANHAFEEAIDLDAKNASALADWGFLLMSKYNTADAERTFSDAIERVPNHPMALIGLARNELQLSSNYTKVRDHLDRAAMLAPGEPMLWTTHAKVAIYDSDCPTAREHANRALKVDKKNLEAMTILAACAYLDDDEKAFEAKVAEVLKLSPVYAEVLTETAEYAVREHRYDEAVDLNRRALKIRERDGAALLQLGIGLSRVGKEDEAQDVLRDAFDADPYNVRAFNMVELYEEVMPTYEFTEYGAFRLRAHQRENDMINALVAPVVKAAMAAFDAKYAHKTEPYLAVEIYPSSETFGVRSVGLPHVSPHGICFGKVVVSRSPSEGNFNWHQVIWHEMAHVYHIQLSRGRVPRWFTEGLAEYETNIKDLAWIRHHDVELSRALAAGTLRGVDTLDKGFTQAKTYEEILRSYHQASLEIHYLVETHGFEKIEKMLRAWGKSKTTSEVFSSVLGITTDEHDRGFQAWLSRRYMNFYGQIRLNVSDESITQIKSQAAKTPDDALIWAQLALAHAREGDLKGAESALNSAQAASKKSPEASLITAYILMQMGRTRTAYDEGLKVLDAGRDSYELRVALGEAALGLEKLDEALVHFQAATQLWSGGIDAWRAIYRIARGQKRPDLEILAMRRAFELDQNDPLLARVFTDYFIKAKNAKLAMRGATRWTDVAPFDPRSHESFAEASMMGGKDAQAEQAIQLLVKLRSQDKTRYLLEGIRLATRYKRSALAKRLEDKALKAGVSKTRISDAKKR